MAARSLLTSSAWHSINSLRIAQYANPNEHTLRPIARIRQARVAPSFASALPSPHLAWCGECRLTQSPWAQIHRREVLMCSQLEPGRCPACNLGTMLRGLPSLEEARQRAGCQASPRNWTIEVHRPPEHPSDSTDPITKCLWGVVASVKGSKSPIVSTGCYPRLWTAVMSGSIACPDFNPGSDTRKIISLETSRV